MQPGVPAGLTAPHGRARERHSTFRRFGGCRRKNAPYSKNRCQAPAFAGALTKRHSVLTRLCPMNVLLLFSNSLRELFTYDFTTRHCVLAISMISSGLSAKKSSIAFFTPGNVA